MQIDPKTSMHSESADQVPREQGCCLLVRSVLCPARGPTEGRHKNTKQNDKQRDKELTQNGQSTNGQLVGQGYYCLSMKPGSHVKDVAVLFADLLHLLDHVLGLDVTAFFRRKVRPAVVSRAPSGLCPCTSMRPCFGEGASGLRR